jgi:hypothetical protein
MHATPRRNVAQPAAITQAAAIIFNKVQQVVPEEMILQLA